MHLFVHRLFVGANRNTLVEKEKCKVKERRRQRQRVKLYCMWETYWLWYLPPLGEGAASVRGSENLTSHGLAPWTWCAMWFLTEFFLAKAWHEQRQLWWKRVSFHFGLWRVIIWLLFNTPINKSIYFQVEVWCDQVWLYTLFHPLCACWVVGGTLFSSGHYQPLAPFCKGLEMQMVLAGMWTCSTSFIVPSYCV